MDLDEMPWADIFDKCSIVSEAQEEADEEYKHRVEALWAIESEMQDKAKQVDAVKDRLKLLDTTSFEKILLYMRAKWLCDGCPVDIQDMEEGDLDSLLEQVVSKLREEFRGKLSGQLQVAHDELDDLTLKRDAADAEMNRLQRKLDALTQEVVVLGKAQRRAYVMQANRRNKLPAMHDGGSTALQEFASADPKPAEAVAEAEEEVGEAAPLEQGREVVAADVASPLEYARGEVLGQGGKVAPTVKSSEPTEIGGAKKKKKKQQPTTTTTVAARRGKKQQGKTAKCRARL